MSARQPLVIAKSCAECKHCESGLVFELCLRDESKYSIAGKDDFHTIGHMRGPRGACGPDGNLYSK